MAAVLVQPRACGIDSDTVLIADRPWTRGEVRAAVHERFAQWAADEAFARAPVVALEATPDAQTLVSMRALVDLGVPFVPMHPAWSETQRQQVLASTEAPLLSYAPPPASSHLEGALARARLRRPLTSDSSLAVVFTSGSTGAPKGAILSHRAFAVSAETTARHLGLKHDEVYYLSLPLAHIGGLSILTRAIVLGGTIVLPSAARGGFDPSEFVARCAATATTVVSLVPTQLRRLCTAGMRAPSTIKVALLGGAPAPTSLLQAAADLGWPVYRTYGLTEACSQVATDRSPGLTGPIELLPHVSARVGRDGRLALRGPAVFSGYWGAPSRAGDDWFLTSDLVSLGPDGVTPLGRVDDLVISGGENIHPEEVDAALTSAPGVIAACSFGRESLEWGQELCAALVTGPDFDARRLLHHLRGVLPSFKIPKAWIVVAELPVTATGKLSRHSCQRAHATTCRPFE